MFSKAELAKDFKRLGLENGDTVMLHASVKSVGLIAGGPDRIHEALLDAVCPDGTIMMYASCPRYYDEVGRGRLSRDEEKEILEKLPSFDHKSDRSAADNGVLVEFLRTYPGTLASERVARFVARGAKAENIISHQPLNYAYGKNSPLAKLLEFNGKIVLLGSDHDAVTFLHYVEHVADFQNKKIARYKVPLLVGTERQWVDVEDVNTAGDGAHDNWPDRFFAQIVDGFLTKTRNQGGKVGHSQTYVLPAKELFEYSKPIMEGVAKDGAKVLSKLIL
jgi:aminoglycoside 3-N-acetyltransferase